MHWYLVALLCGSAGAPVDVCTPYQSPPFDSEQACLTDKYLRFDNQSTTVIVKKARCLLLDTSAGRGV